MLRVVFYLNYLFLSVVNLCAQLNTGIENLGKNVNSAAAELMPMVSVDGKTLYFVRDGHPENNCFKQLRRKIIDNAQDIWYSELQADSTWGPARHMESPFNQECSQSIVYISPDNNSIFLNSVVGFLVSKKTKKGWSNFKAVEIPELYDLDQGMFKTMAFAPNQKAIIFSFSKKVDAEVNDLFVSVLNKNNEWTKPRRLPVNVNTRDDETCPFLAADGKTLYFSSNRPGGLGSHDLYVTHRLDEKWLVWSDPENLGAGFNTKGWDGYYSTDAKANYAYMVTTNSPDGSADIVRKSLIIRTESIIGDTIHEKTGIQPETIVLLYGNVYDEKTRLPIEAQIDYQVLGTGENAGIANSDPLTGSYKIVLNYGENYGIYATASGFISISDHIDLSTHQSYQEIKKDLFLAPIEVGQIVKLNNIFFDSNKSELKPESYPELDRVVEALNNNLKLEIEIDGYTDNVGQDDYNLKLSEERARAVHRYLLGKGILKSRLSSKGFGKQNPVDDNQTESGRQNNRRVEFVILKK
ncbi:MAG: OmpA family protein [Bacteroidales bacterium]